MVLIGLVGFGQQMISSHEQTAREILYNNNVIQTDEACFLFLCLFSLFSFSFSSTSELVAHTGWMMCEQKNTFSLYSCPMSKP